MQQYLGILVLSQEYLPYCRLSFCLTLTSLEQPLFQISIQEVGSTTAVATDQASIYIGFALEQYNLGLDQRDKKLQVEYRAWLRSERAATKEQIKKRAHIERALDITHKKLLDVEVQKTLC